MTTAADLQRTWPDLFHDLTERQTTAVLEAIASGIHEGWTPTREDVADLIAHTRGDITTAEYRDRALAKAHRRAHHG